MYISNTNGIQQSPQPSEQINMAYHSKGLVTERADKKSFRKSSMSLEMCLGVWLNYNNNNNNNDVQLTKIKP